MSLLQVSNLIKTYSDGTEALRGATFSVDRGEFVAIMGPSGSGKSTLLHIIGLLDKQTSGEYLFEEKKIADFKEEELAMFRNKKMGFVFQMFNLLPKATVLENVKLPLLYSHLPESDWDDLAKEAIASVGLSHRINNLALHLSGGEKQRVAIARALINKPEIIFADEPTGNLDSRSGQSVMDIFQKLNEEKGHTIILITHETYTAEHAKRVLSIKDGVIESDKPISNRRLASSFFK